MIILAIDDEKLALANLVAELKKVFVGQKIYDFLSSFNALSFIEKIKNKNENIDYIFMDIKMPTINGLEMAKIVKNMFPKTKIFFCTAYSEYSLEAWNMKVKGYILKPISAQKIEEVLQEMVGNWKEESVENLIKVKTFGDFEVFLNGKPIEFERSKAKELLAYLVDRKGAAVTTERIASILFEDRNYDRTLKNMTTTIISSLRKTLKKYGIENIIVKSWNQIAIDVDKIKCDAYDFEKYDLVAINSYEGDYMYGYSWAEFSIPKYDQLFKEYKKNK